MYKALIPAIAAAGLISIQAPAFAQNSTLTLKAGTFNCELNQSIQVEKVSADHKTAVFKWAKKNYTLHAVNTSTGALRYEDKASGMVWLMVSNKSMLLNSKHGQRLADECRAA